MVHRSVSLDKIPYVVIEPLRVFFQAINQCCVPIGFLFPGISHCPGKYSYFPVNLQPCLPGSLHTNKIPVILGRYPLLGFLCCLNIVPLDRDNGTFNSSNTDVVENVNFLVAASQHGGTSVAEGSP